MGMGVQDRRVVIVVPACAAAASRAVAAVTVVNGRCGCGALVVAVEVVSRVDGAPAAAATTAAL